MFDKISYSLPRIDEIFNRLAGAKFFTVLDLRNVYLQLQVDDKLQEFLRISTPWGFYRQTRLVISLNNSARIFQKIMNDILEG